MEDGKNTRFEEQQKDQQEKLFTQEDVEEILKKRLARERRRYGREAGDGEENSDREKDLAEREMKLLAKEKLMEAGMPLGLADVLRYSDEKTLDNAIQVVKNLNQASQDKKAWGQRMQSQRGGPDQFRQAMGLDRKG